MISTSKNRYLPLVFSFLLTLAFAVPSVARALTNPDGSVYCAKESYWELAKTGAVTGQGDTGSGYSTLVPLHYSNDTSYNLTGNPAGAGATLRYHYRVVGPDAVSAGAWDASWATNDCTTASPDGAQCSAPNEGIFWLQQETPSDPACSLQSGFAVSPPNRIDPNPPPPALTASCSATPSTAFINKDVTWAAAVSGGTGTYSYSWTGTDGLSGTTSSVFKSYPTTGTKNGTVTVTSGTQIVSTDCSVQVKIESPASISGYHDGASGSVDSSQCSAFGWATYPSYSNLKVKVLSDGAEVATGVANGYRGDLTGVCSGGNCAYNIDLNNKISYGANHSIAVQAQDPVNGTWETLATSPKTLNCSASGTPPVGENPPTVDISASPATVNYGSSSALSWTTGGDPTSCLASGDWSGAKSATGGSENTGPLYSARTYTITCSNGAGSATDSVVVNVNPGTSGTGAIAVNSSLATTWTITGPATLTQATDIASKTYTGAPTGTYTITPAAKDGYSYTVSAASSQTLANGGTITFNINYVQNAGVISVSSNLLTTWNITGPATYTQSTDYDARTYTGAPPGAYTIAPATKFGYSYSVNANPQTLENDGTIVFVITYTSTAPNTGTVVVSSNLPTTWTITGPTTLTQTSDSTSKTYAGEPLGTYTISPAGKSGYTYSVGANPQTLSDGGTIVFAITYTEMTSGEPLSITCLPTATMGRVANFSASGGTTGTYSWTATQSPSPSSKVGDRFFSTTWSRSGVTARVTVVNGPESAYCDVNVISTTPDYSISPSASVVYLKTGETTGAGPNIFVTPYNGFASRVYFCTTGAYVPVFSPAFPTLATILPSPKPIYSPYTGGIALQYSFRSPLEEGRHAVRVYASTSGTSSCDTQVRGTTYDIVVNETGQPPKKAKGIIPPFEEF